MQCSSCGTQLPEGGAFCPACGALTPYRVSESGVAPYDLTAASSPSDAPQQAPPATDYGSPPYGVPPQNLYEPLNPYAVPLQAPPPPLTQRPGKRIGIIVGVVLLVLLLIGGGVFVWLEYSSASNAAVATAQATATAQAIAAATANFTAKGTATTLSGTTTKVQQDGDNQISTIIQHSVFSGDITGSFTTEETDILHPDKTVTFSGRATCTCTVAGKSGILMWSYIGTSTADGSFQGQFFDIQGTGDLAKLHGQGTFQGQGTHSTYSSELHFDSYPGTGTGSPVLTEFALPTRGGVPYEITAGPDGNLWFTEINGNQIGRISPMGTITEFPISTAKSVPGDIALGPDGNLWFTELQSSKIGRISPSGTISEFSLPAAGSQPLGIVRGPDGNLWFIENGSNKIGRISPTGAISDFPIPTANSRPFGIALGPDGNLWFTEVSANQIGRISPKGTISEFPIPTAGSGPQNIALGPDGNLWFTEILSNKIGRISPSGTISEFSLPTAGSKPFGIVRGPDGNLWFTEIGSSQIGRISPTGSISEFPIPTANSKPYGIALGPDGNLWFTEELGNQIGRFTAPATASAALQTFTAKGTFTVLSSTTTSVRQDGNNKIESITVQEVLYGDITGSHTIEETLILHPDNTGNIYGNGTCTCTVAGKSGTLMWSLTGTSTANDSFQGQVFDVHGTGDLTNMHGQGVFQGQGLHGTYSLELHFAS